MKFFYLFFLFAVLSVQPLLAQTYHVNAANANPGDGTTWASAFTTLQAALDVATSGNEIRVAKGTYKPSVIFAPGVASPGEVGPNNRYNTFQLKSGVAIYGGYDDQGNGTRNILLNETILSGDLGVLNDNSDNAYNVVMIVNGTTGVVLDGLTITGGYANGTQNRSLSSASHPAFYGGGILLRNSDGIFRNLKIIRNTARTNSSATYGGGFFIATTSSNAVELNNIEFIENDISTGGTNFAGGGALYLAGPNIKLNQLRFIGNSAKTGGAIFTSLATTNLKLGNTIFNNNSASSHGGAIYLTNNGSASVLVNTNIVNNTFYNNTAEIGGAIYLLSHVNNTLDIRNTILLGNTATISDADIFKGDNSNLTISHSLTQSYNPNNITSVVTGANLVNVFINTTDANHADFLKLKHDDTNPAIDAGGNGQYDLVTFGDKDLAGNNRIFNSGLNSTATIDLGAYENSVVPLPVELLRYDAKLQGNRTILSWVTSAEKNSSHYVIERGSSPDSFGFLKRVEAAGNTSVEQSYHATDEAPLSGINYYRLTQYDLDGTSKILGTRAVSLSLANAGSQIYPNPARNSVSFRLPVEVVGAVQVDLVSIGGAVVLSRTFEKDAEHTLDISNITAGTYILRIKNGANIYTHTLLVIN